MKTLASLLNVPRKLTTLLGQDAEKTKHDPKNGQFTSGGGSKGDANSEKMKSLKVQMSHAKRIRDKHAIEHLKIDMRELESKIRRQLKV